MRRLAVAVCALLISVVACLPALAENQDTFTFKNETGKKVNDLHIEWSRAVSIKSVDTFKKTSGSGTSKADFSKGDVLAKGSVGVTVTWDGTDPTVKSWYWTLDGKKVRSEKANSVVCSTTDTSAGMLAVRFATESGVVTAYLPADMAAGDTIRGFVEPRPVGNTGAERQEASDTLSGYVVEIDGKRFGKSDNFMWTIPPLFGGIASIVLKDGMGKVISQRTLPINPNPIPIEIRPIGMPFDIPDMAQSGKPAHIPGSWNPTSPSTVTIGGMEVPVLAEGPRGATVLCPSNLVGMQEITIKDGATTATGQIGCLKARLSSPKTNLMTGERGQVTAQIEGLGGLKESSFPVVASIFNHTPETVRFQHSSGAEFTHEITKAEVDAQGMFTMTLPIVALMPGAFDMSCEVGKGRCGATTHVDFIEKLAKRRDDDGYFVEWREDCFVGTCRLNAGHGGSHAYSWNKCGDHASKPHKEYFKTAGDRDARYRELEKEKEKRDAENGR